MSSVNELIKSAANRVVFTVDKGLLNVLLLLSNVHDLFSSFATELMYNLDEEIVTLKLVTSEYIVSSLTACY